MELVGSARRKQRHVATLGPNDPHLRTRRFPRQRNRAPLRKLHVAVAQLTQPNFQISVHDGDRLIMRRGEPGRRPFDPQRLNHILPIDTDGNLLVRLGHRGDFEDIREGIVFGVIVDNLDTTLLIVVQAAQHRAVTLRHSHLLCGFQQSSTRPYVTTHKAAMTGSPERPRPPGNARPPPQATTRPATPTGTHADAHRADEHARRSTHPAAPPRSSANTDNRPCTVPSASPPATHRSDTASAHPPTPSRSTHFPSE